jgi:hypothetical protein
MQERENMNSILRLAGLSTLLSMLTASGCLTMAMGCVSPQAQPQTFEQGQQSHEKWLESIERGHGNAIVSSDGEFAIFFGTKVGIKLPFSGHGSANFSQPTTVNNYPPLPSGVVPK